MDVSERTWCHQQLAQLVLPTIFVVLTTSGTEVARRLNNHDLEMCGAEALREMRELHLLPGAKVALDVTAPLPVVS